MQQLFARIHTQFGDIVRKNTNRELNIKIIRLDNGGEFVHKKLHEDWEKKDIRIEHTISHIYNQNSVAERGFQTIINHAVSILDEANLPKNL